MAVTPTITNNIEHTTLKTRDLPAYSDITITAESGYIILNYDISPSDNATQISINKARKILTFRITAKEDPQTITVTGQSIESQFTISMDVPNAKLKSIDSGHLGGELDGEIQDFGCTIEADSDYKILTAKLEYSAQSEYRPDTSKEFTIQEDGKTATITGITAIRSIGLKISGTTEKAATTKTITITQSLTNCTSNAPESIKQGNQLDVTLTATESNKFKTPPTLNYDSTSENFSVTGEGKTATISFDTSKVTGESITITATAEQEQEPITPSKYGSIGVYVVTMEDIEKFAQERFFKVAGEGEYGPNYENVDLGNYVHNIFRIHTQINAISEDKIICGNYTTSITAKTPVESQKTLNFGDVVLPAHNDNITDYKSVYKLLLPFYGFVDIPNEYTGKTINLKYIINVITGGAMAIVSNDNIPFLYQQLQVKTDIIFKTNNYNDINTIGADDWNESIFYGLKPFILCEWYESADYGRNNDRKRVIIGECEGYNQFNEIDQITDPKMTITEQNRIYELLESGIYIDKVV